MEELLLWVDENDEVIGYGEKLLTHEQKRLHRAFSVFLYNRNDRKLLLHRRADGKYHSGGLWTNSCCSHPRKGESLTQAVLRRLREELGFELTDAELEKITEAGDTIREVGKFRYFHDYGQYAESEIDHVFYIPISRDEVVLTPNPEEISEILWITAEELQEWKSDRPQDFTAWFSQAFSMVYPQIRSEEDGQNQA